jgi:peptidoglycan/LPS O-acetylase OafA/YrhL
VSSALHRKDGRIFGLDLMRATAIALVVLVHADDLLSAHWPGHSAVSRIDGVDLFFVLSGYLVGGILLRYAEAVDVPWRQRLFDFWQRRWLRTLPNYYLFLLINIVLVLNGQTMGLINANVAAYFVFMQNFHVPLDLFFWESWSLAVEEWFYLLFPALLFVVLRGLRVGVRPGFLVAVLAMLIVPTVLRFVQAEGIDTLFNKDLYIRKLVVTRLDTIGFGVLAAWCHRYFAEHWTRLRFPLLSIGLLGLAWCTAYRGEQHLMYLATWYFTGVGLTMALLLPALSLWVTRAAWTRPIVFLSRISYALYLVHMPLRYPFLRAVEGSSPSRAVGLYVLYLALAVVLSAAVYRWYERPFMGLREKYSRRLVSSSS